MEHAKESVSLQRQKTLLDAKYFNSLRKKNVWIKTINRNMLCFEENKLKSEQMLKTYLQLRKTEASNTGLYNCCSFYLKLCFD